MSENIFWQSKDGIIHACESRQVHTRVKLVWTKCLIDVPANQGFTSDYDKPTCAKCVTTPTHGE